MNITYSHTTPEHVYYWRQTKYSETMATISAREFERYLKKEGLFNLVMDYNEGGQIMQTEVILDFERYIQETDTKDIATDIMNFLNQQL